MMVRLCLYVVGAPADPIRERHGTYADWFGRLIAEHDATVEVFDGTGGLLPEFDALDAVIITGSPASLTTPEPWMEAGVELCREAYRQALPLLGVCFGHQLMGAAFGGEVVENPAGWQLGTFSVELSERGRADPLFDGMPEAFEVNLSHRDAVRPDTLAPSNGAHVLAGNAKASIQAIAAGPHLRGVQFHPEFSGAVVRAFLDLRRDILIEDAERRDAPQDHPDRVSGGVRDSDMGEQVFHNFIRHFAGRGR